MERITVRAGRKISGELHADTENHRFIFNYLTENPVSITMPFSHESYVSRFHLHPIFDMNVPEGYLFELLVNLLRKELGDVDDFLIFRTLAPAMEGWLTYEADHSLLGAEDFETLALEDVVENDDPDLFRRLVDMFLLRSAVSGVQPKVLASLWDKGTVQERSYVVKAFGPEFPHLAENEYFCMEAMKAAEIPTPRYWLSRDRKLLIVERFDYDESAQCHLAFEEFAVLFGKHRRTKYQGSYEKVAKAIRKISCAPEEDLRTFFKMIVMSFLLRNGDAHLKNFGILYRDPAKIRLAPAYDVICTTAYLPRDKPALTLFGKKAWLPRERLLQFGVSFCALSEQEANELFDVCLGALSGTIQKLKRYSNDHPEFKEFGNRLIETFTLSLKEHLETGHGILEHRPQDPKNQKTKETDPAGPGR